MGVYLSSYIPHTTECKISVAPALFILSPINYPPGSGTESIFRKAIKDGMIIYRLLELVSLFSILIYNVRDAAAQSFTITQNYTGNTL